jgi:hypothetical protein
VSRAGCSSDSAWSACSASLTGEKQRRKTKKKKSRVKKKDTQRLDKRHTKNKKKQESKKKEGNPACHTNVWWDRVDGIREDLKLHERCHVTDAERKLLVVVMTWPVSFN